MDKWIETAMQAVNEQITQEFNKEPIKTLGEIILLLKSQPQDNRVDLDFDSSYDLFRLNSYRGYYQYLALDYNNTQGTQLKPNNTVSQVLKLFEDAEGREFTGYKGGEFLMHSKTIVFVSPYSTASERMLVDIKKKPKNVTVICTKIHVESDSI
jgi:hypothetical protein